MDREKAKILLRNYRPGETDMIDRATEEALVMARTDAELAKWFGKHCAEVAQSSARRTPATSLDLEKPTEEAVSQQRAKKNRAMPWAIAGVALLILAVLLYFLVTPPKPENTIASFRSRMARMVQRSFPLKMDSASLDLIRDYLRTNSGATGFDLPRNLEKLPGKGAAVMTWHGQPVSLVGFEAGGRTNLYLFLASRDEFMDPPEKGSNSWGRIGGLMTVCWTSGTNIYLLAGPNDETYLKGMLE